jgi:hypothetical protein
MTMFSKPSREGKKIRGYWRGHGRLNEENRKKIRRAMKDAGVGAVSLPTFLYHEKYQKKHAAVVKLLKL